MHEILESITTNIAENTTAIINAIKAYYEYVYVANSNIASSVYAIITNIDGYIYVSIIKTIMFVYTVLKIGFYLVCLILFLMFFSTKKKPSSTNDLKKYIKENFGTTDDYL